MSSQFKRASIEEAKEASNNSFVWWRPDGDINPETEHCLVFIEEEE